MNKITNLKYRICIYCKNQHQFCCRHCDKEGKEYPLYFIENPYIQVYDYLNKQVLLDDVLEEEKVEEVENRNVQHPNHYTEGREYEPIDVIEDWQLNFCRANAVKYISRAGRKDPQKEIEDLEKAIWYLEKEIDFIKKRKSNA